MKNILAERLREEREAYNYTQKDIADKLGLTKGAYGCYERGVSSPDALTLLKLANIYGVTTDYLVGNSNTRKPLNELSPKENKALLLASKVSEKQIDSIISTVFNLLDIENEEITDGLSPRERKLLSMSKNLTDEQVESLTKIVLSLIGK